MRKDHSDRVRHSVKLLLKSQLGLIGSRNTVLQLTKLKQIHKGSLLNLLMSAYKNMLLHVLNL